MSFKSNNFFDVIAFILLLIVLLCIIAFGLLETIAKIKLFLTILFG